MGKRKQYKIFFSEEQRLSNSPKKWIFILAYVLVFGPLGYGMIQQLLLGKPWGNYAMSNSRLMFAFSLVVLVMSAIVFLQTQIRLVVFIDKEGIHYRFPVFIRKEKLIKKEQIVSYDVRKYRPLLEYGGWVYRTRYFYMDKGITYNIMGHIGLQLYLSDGKKLLIGTQRPEAMKRAMKRLMEENEHPYD